MDKNKKSRTLRRMLRETDAATTMEWALLLAAIAIPSYYTIRLALMSIVGHYQMMTALNSLPFP